MKKLLNILIPILIIIFLIICKYTIINNKSITTYSQPPQNSQINPQNVDKILKEANLVKTFEIIGTVSMERFCSDEGYVPTKFISEYKNRFYNTFLNADDILKQKNYPLNKDDKLYEIYVKKGIEQLNIEYNSFNAQKEASKKEFCQFYDEESNLMVELIGKDFEKLAPNIYKDK